MERTFLNVSKKKLSSMTCKWYGAGKELQINDKVCSGFTINYANLNGKPLSKYDPNEISVSLKMFVEKDGMLYELYKNSKQK